MPATGTQFGNRIVTQASDDVTGLGSFQAESTNPNTTPPDSCRFQRWTGTSVMPDLTSASGTVVFVAPANTQPGGTGTGTPRGMRCYITSLQIAVSTAFSGGTAGTVSMSVQDTAGNVIATYTQADLTAGLYLSLPSNTLPGAVVDNLIKAMGPCTALNQGIRIVMSNSTAGVVRVRMAGQYAP